MFRTSKKATDNFMVATPLANGLRLGGIILQDKLSKASPTDTI